jgi:hypothetical protein
LEIEAIEPPSERQGAILDQQILWPKIILPMIILRFGYAGNSAATADRWSAWPL